MPQSMGQPSESPAHHYAEQGPACLKGKCANYQLATQACRNTLGDLRDADRIVSADADPQDEAEKDQRSGVPGRCRRDGEDQDNELDELKNEHAFAADAVG
jgi:hypothetical protein